jgi:hypothetical protein
MMMEAASTSETSVNFYQTTQRYNPEDSHLHTRRHENLKSYLMMTDLNYFDTPTEIIHDVVCDMSICINSEQPIGQPLQADSF